MAARGATRAAGGRSGDGAGRAAGRGAGRAAGAGARARGAGARARAGAGGEGGPGGAGPAPALQEHLWGEVRAAVAAALAEDLGPAGDVTALATVAPRGGGERVRRAELLAKAAGVLAGTGVVEEVCRAVDPRVRCHWRAADGARVERGDVLGFLEGPALSLLSVERTALNFLQRMSGIATATAEMVAAAERGGGRARVLETRKTAPGLRAVDKWAVAIGGGENHRYGLYDMMLVKDNHIAAAGGVAAALGAAVDWIEARGSALEVEVETRTLDEVREVLRFLDERPGAEECVKLIMLDNMVRWAEPGPGEAADGGRLDTSMLEAGVALVGGRLLTEASGNVTLATVGRVAAAGVDRVSCGALTHSVTALDISLNISLD